MAEFGAALLARYYERGELGSRKQVERELGQAGSGGSGAAFFDAAGHLLPYAKLDQEQQFTFNRWMYGNARVEAITRVNSKIAADIPKLKAVCGT